MFELFKSHAKELPLNGDFRQLRPGSFFLQIRKIGVMGGCIMEVGL